MLAFEAVLMSGLQPVRPLEFHWYAGEERGLLGSRVMADKYEQLGQLPLAMLNLDMGGGPLGEASFRFIGDFVSTSLTRESPADRRPCFNRSVQLHSQNNGGFERLCPMRCVLSGAEFEQALVDEYCINTWEDG